MPIRTGNCNYFIKDVRDALILLKTFFFFYDLFINKISPSIEAISNKTVIKVTPYS